MTRRRFQSQSGAAMLIILVALTLAAAYVFLRAAKTGRNQATVSALAQAKEALIGFAATYRDSHQDLINGFNQPFGFLPCPDSNNDGVADPAFPPCGPPNVSVIGRLPWQTLGIPPLRDSGGECLWYAVSGHGKDNPQTASMNWDTTGQFTIMDAGGAVLTPGSAHDQAMAVVFAPGVAIGAQARPSVGVTQCGGNSIAAAYLDGGNPIYTSTPAADATSTLTVSTADSARIGTNNDQAIWITAGDIFGRARVRSDFARDINTLMDNMKICLDRKASAPGASGSDKGFGGPGSCPALIPDCDPYNYVTKTAGCPPYNTAGTPVRNVLENWRNNLLYAKPVAPVMVNGRSCSAVLLFGGARAAGQTRSSAAEIASAANYLEGPNLATFTTGIGGYTGVSAFKAASSTADLARCVTGIPPASVSFAKNFGSFAPSGNGVAADGATQTVLISGAAGTTTGGCFWYPDAIPLAGKTLRAFYRYTFSQPDTYALTHAGTDRGNGFTFQLVRGDLKQSPPHDTTLPESPVTANVCGTVSNMGALTVDVNSPGATFALHSFIVETDIRQDSGNGNSDPAANHTAIMANGNLDHQVGNSSSTTACDGTAAGCTHSPANTFEESPTPATHSQRIEIETGCNSTCSSCNPPSHGGTNSYARIRTWVDCTDCSDTLNDFPETPNAQRCINLDLKFNSAFFGFTGGFRASSTSNPTDPPYQGVTLQDFILLSQ
ncbi:MAG: hypothetical protein H6R10_320 [Rhodocyclaceae bacterium]|nr:hypothetical protein [Rhodocyclaceae bacterium]